MKIISEIISNKPKWKQNKGKGIIWMVAWMDQKKVNESQVGFEKTDKSMKLQKDQ